MRCFVAIPLPFSVRDSISRLCLSLKRHDSAIRWVVPENFHINLKFLGEVEPDRFDEKFFSEWTQLLSPFEPISLTVRTLGQFPARGIPRVFWGGVGGEGFPILQQLSLAVEDFFDRHGFPKEDRVFRPHVTLARLKAKASSGLLKVWREAADAAFGNFVADRVVFFKSELTKGGAVYSVIREFPLVFSPKK